MFLEGYSRNTSREESSTPQNLYKMDKTENQVDRQRKMLTQDNTNISLLITAWLSAGGLHDTDTCKRMLGMLTQS